MIGELDMREGGESEGPGTGTSDDIPAMLSDGEFVMTAKLHAELEHLTLTKPNLVLSLLKVVALHAKKV